MGCDTDPFRGMSDFMGQSDPQHLPGRGLMRADNFSGDEVGNEYDYMLRQYLNSLPMTIDTEKTLGPKAAEARLATTRAMMQGTPETPGMIEQIKAADP